MVKILCWLALSCLSGVLYRIGGTSAGTKWRDLGVPAVSLILLLCLLRRSLILFLSPLKIGLILTTYGLMFASLTTYWKKKGADAKWWNWLATGVGYGLSTLPLIWCGIHWWAILVRAIFLAISIMWLRERTGKVFKEEFFSGLLFCLTIPLLLL